MTRATVVPVDGKAPKFGRNVFLAPSAAVLGDVRLGDRVSVWYATVLRGDVHTITVGAESNLQDGVVVHGTLGEWPVVIGARTSIGHGAVIHGATLGDDVLVGIGARVLDGAVVGRYSLIAAGAVVREGTQIPERSLVAGVPAQVKRALSDAEIERITRTPGRYHALAAQHRKALLAAGHDDPFFGIVGS